MGSDKSPTIRLRLDSFIPIPTDDVARVTFTNWSNNKVVLFMAILNLCQNEGYCYASKRWLADECRVDVKTVNKYLNEFIRDGYLKKGDFKKRVRVLVPTEKTLDRFFA